MLFGNKQQQFSSQQLPQLSPSCRSQWNPNKLPSHIHSSYQATPAYLGRGNSTVTLTLKETPTLLPHTNSRTAARGVNKSSYHSL
jgi:hypothetical protein